MCDVALDFGRVSCFRVRQVMAKDFVASETCVKLDEAHSKPRFLTRILRRAPCSRQYLISMDFPCESKPQTSTQQSWVV